jgi:glycosyltransferase involved in cell wall biosynthesis
MRVLFIGKRHYTNRDAFEERFGRIYQLPLHWSRGQTDVKLCLIDYYGTRTNFRRDGDLDAQTVPVRRPIKLWKFWKEIRAKKEWKPDIVVASGDCYIGLLGHHIAKHHSAKFIFDIYDKYDEFGSYVSFLGFNPFSYLISRASQCWFASWNLLKELGNTSRGDCVIANGVDMQRFFDRNISEARARIGFHDKETLIGYFGSMEPDRGVADLIAATALLRKSGRILELVLAGRTHPDLDLSVPGVRYVGNLAFDEVPWALASMNVVVVPYRRSAFMDAGASNKIVEAIASRRPLAATATPNFTANFPKQALTLQDRLAEPGNPGSLAGVIAKQLDDPVLCDPPQEATWDAIAAKALNQLITP